MTMCKERRTEIQGDYLVTIETTFFSQFPFGDCNIAFDKNGQEREIFRTLTEEARNRINDEWVAQQRIAKAGWEAERAERYRINDEWAAAKVEQKTAEEWEAAEQRIAKAGREAEKVELNKIEEEKRTELNRIIDERREAEKAKKAAAAEKAVLEQPDINNAIDKAEEWGGTAGAVLGGKMIGELGNYLAEEGAKKLGYKEAGQKIAKLSGGIIGGAVGGTIGVTCGSLISREIADQVVRNFGIDTVGTTLPGALGTTSVGMIGTIGYMGLKTIVNSETNFYDNFKSTTISLIPTATIITTAKMLPIIGNSSLALGVLGYGVHKAANYYKYGDIKITISGVCGAIMVSTVNRAMIENVGGYVSEIVGEGILGTLAVPLLTASTAIGALYGVGKGYKLVNAKIREYRNSQSDGEQQEISEAIEGVISNNIIAHEIPDQANNPTLGLERDQDTYSGID